VYVSNKLIINLPNLFIPLRTLHSFYLYLGMKQTNSANTPEKFHFDLMENERLRSMFVGVTVLLIIIVLFLYIFLNYDLFAQNFTNRFYWFAGIFLLVFLAVRGFLISKYIKVLYLKKKTIPKKFLYVNVLFEVSIPSAIILFFGLQVNPYVSLISPLTQIYFIMIVLTIMEMDMRISTFAGILSGLEFFIISYYLKTDFEPPNEFALIGTNMYYVGRSMMMIGTGVIAGFLAERIKNSAINLYTQQEETRKIEQLFGQQLSPQIAKRLMESTSLIQPEKHQACIMFLDIRDFTQTTENMSPEEIIGFQNHIFSDMFGIVNQYNGVVNQIMGDGFMATFGAPVTSNQCCEEAVQCSLSLLSSLKKMNQQSDFPKTRFGIGLHYGSVVTGNIGTEERRQFSITGQTVIIASRIEQLNKTLDTQLLFSEDVHQQLANHKFEFTKFGKHPIKGLSQPVNIFGM